jgi:two-component system, LytTR family, sensor histidine kinase AlgZ
MHPILARAYRLALYLLVWLGVGAVLSRAIARPGGLDLSQATAIVLPLSVLYGFVCLSSWYVCRATPLRAAGPVTILANIGGATAFASAMWAVAGRSWAWVISRSLGFEGANTAFARDTFLLFVVDALLYLVMVAAHYVMIAAEESRASDQRVLQIQLQAREAELKALKAQIEPHFLFNSLNSISALATADPPGARRMCVLLGEFLRASLKLGLRERIPLADELALVRRYFEIEQVRFGARLRLEQTIEDGIGDCLVPPLLLQPLAENAVGHGIAQTLEGGTVRLEARRRDGALRILIENPVDRDRPKKARGGVGLDNVRRRLATHYAGRAALDIEQHPESFSVTITMPCGSE